MLMATRGFIVASLLKRKEDRAVVNANQYSGKSYFLDWYTNNSYLCIRHYRDTYCPWDSNYFIIGLRSDYRDRYCPCDSNYFIIGGLRSDRDRYCPWDSNYFIIGLRSDYRDRYCPWDI